MFYRLIEIPQEFPPPLLQVGIDQSAAISSMILSAMSW